MKHLLFFVSLFVASFGMGCSESLSTSTAPSSVGGSTVTLSDGLLVMSSPRGVLRFAR